jgi:trk system potassium uptake protein TrkH
MGGIVKLTAFILKATFLTELAGAVVMMPTFTRDYGARGFWMAIFHSISAFCNAGFDIMGTPDKPFQSLTSYGLNPVINVTICMLIILGGIGFITWNDAFIHKHHFRYYCMQSKVILVTTALLIFIPSVIFFHNDFANMPTTDKLFYSLFQAVTPRTAGFNTADFNAMTGPGRAITIILMLIGGSPGSTAGGMKTTTIAVLFANSLASFRHHEDVQLFHRRIEPQVVRDAAYPDHVRLSVFRRRSGNQYGRTPAHGLMFI